MSAVRHTSGRAALEAYRLSQRLRARLFAAVCGGGFAAFGREAMLMPPIRVSGADRIHIGPEVFIGANSYLLVLEGEGRRGEIVIGEDAQMTGDCTISSAVSVRIGRKALLARNVYVADHRHAFDSAETAILDQGFEQVAAVEIGDGAWLGQNVVVGPGVRIGRGAVVGANSVVLSDVPDRAVAVGAPARVVRSIDADATPPPASGDRASGA
jgi:acetyltransferase-like isoleucine patch superfamily enzyme